MITSRHRSIPSLLAMAMLLGACVTGEPVTEQALAPKAESTKIFAADGSVITTLKQEENRETIAYKDIPKHLRDAVVAVEDARFFTHRGVDARAILRAMYANASTGKVVEGGSTITQQLVRNAVADIGREQTIERKMREASYAYQVDQSFSKEKILELYLNTVYFGQGAYGVQTASQSYFGKDVKDIDLAQAALLAGLVKSPVNYDPRTNPDAALNRRNLVLDRMIANDLIDPAAAEAAKQLPLQVADKVDTDRYAAAYFVDYVNRQIQRSNEFAALGATELERGNKLFRGGLRIHTTLDPKVQASAEEAIAKVLDRPESDPAASLVAIDPKNGFVKALVGGRDFFAPQDQDPCVRLGAKNADGTPKTCAKVNLALGQGGGGSGRQPGSAFKPFVLAAALSKGKRLTDTYPASACLDIPGADGGGTRAWHVCNYEEQAFGNTTIAEATTKSINTVYAQMVMDVGPQAVIENAEKLGICETTRPLLPEGKACHLQAVPAAALGANSVSTLDMASAFTTFPMMGVHVRPVSITKITDAQGALLWQPVEKKEQVLNPGVSYLATTALEDVITKGTASRSGKIGRPAFGKTGTAQEWRDAWFVGGAGTDLVAAVSVFWPDGEIEMKPSCSGRRTEYQIVEQGGKPYALPPECRQTRIRVTGGSWPTQIWQIFMLKALDGVPASQFPVPQVEVVEVAVDTTRGCLPNPYTPPSAIEKESFIKGTEPTEICKEPTGPVVALVPSVIGFPEDQAMKLLRQAGFEVIRQEEPSRLFPPGRVNRQDPAPDTEVPPGSKVTIYISIAGNLKPVPDVVNMSEEDARATLHNAGFQVQTQRLRGCKPRDRCSVRDQDPDGGTEAFEGTRVTIYLGPSG